MSQPALLRRAAVLAALVLLALGAVPPSADGYTFVPIFDDDVVACVRLESITYVALAGEAELLAQAVGAPALLMPLWAVVDPQPSGAGTLEFHGCAPAGNAASRLDARGYQESPAVPLPGFARALCRSR